MTRRYHDEHRVLVRQPRHRDRRAAAADRRPGAGHPGQPAGPAARPAQVRSDRPAPEPVPAVGGVHRRSRADRGGRYLRAYPADLRGRAVRLGLRAAVAGPGRGLAGHHARDDRDQPAPRPPEPDSVAGRPPAGLRQLAGRVRAQHRLEQGPAAGLDARPGRRLRVDRRGGGDLAAGSGRPAGAQGPAGRRDLRAAPDRPGDAMTTVVNQSAPGGAARQAAGLPRLLPAAPEDLRAHLARYGPAPYRNQPGALIADVEASGLTGRGGAAFPVHRKLAAVARAGVRQGRAVVVANGAESEPASHKDELLLQFAPNLVLDGLQLAVEAVGATEAHLYLHRAPGPQILRALADRAARGLDRLAVTITQAPPRFLAGQETAVVNRLGGGPALPTFQPPRVSERGLGGAPTLMQNVETLAHLALIARYGPRWFRAVGTSAEPGSMLTTIYRPDVRTHIHEAAIGTPLRALLGDGAGVQAWLVGGYHGTWLPMPDAAEITLDNASLRRFGTATGAGVLAALPSDRCGLTEAARVTRYLAAESAGQCGPCLNGLPRIAAALAELAGSGHRRQTLDDLKRWSGPQNLVEGRGACHHPDGTVRFVRSALAVFGPEIHRHARGQCSATNHTPFLPLPPGMPTREEDWT